MKTERENLLNILTRLDYVSSQGPFEDAEIDFLCTCIQSNDPEICATASILLTGEEDKDRLLRMIPLFKQASPLQKRLMVGPMSTIPYHEVHEFFIEELKTEQNPETVVCLSVVLGTTDYPVLPYLLMAIRDADEAFLERLKKVFKHFSFERIKSQLAVFPVLPFPRFFKEVYGEKAIDSLF
ncbi:MAG: hypothetical protein AB7F28_06570 [Candidatus Margulisiibacteriota bacterium]